MKFLSLMGVAALASASMAVPAFAQTLTPVGPTLSASGPALLNTTSCTLTLPVTATGTGSTGTAANGTNTGAGACPTIKINLNPPDAPATFVLSAYNPTGGAAGLGSATGTISNVIVRAGAGSPPPQACPTGNGLTFTVENRAGGGVRITFPTTTVGPCTLRATLDAPGFTLNP
ncbi:MAG: hypothetical protein V4564_18080 [Pseudomonadota bacterium]